MLAFLTFLGGETLNRFLANVGFAMALIGGIIFIILGISGMLGIFWLIFYPMFSLSVFFWGIVMLGLGIVCAAGAKFVWNVPTAILLLLCGIFAGLIGAWFASWLVIIGAILGMISRA